MSEQIKNFDEILKLKNEINNSVNSLNKNLIEIQKLGIRTFCKQKDAFYNIPESVKSNSTSCSVLEIQMDLSI